MADRVEWIDAARGIGIVLVVLGHVARGLVAAGVAHGSAWEWLDYSLYTFHMPLFFLLAGVNLPRSLQHGKASFLGSKIWTILYPYVLWSLIQGTILIELSAFTNAHPDWSSLWTIGWRPMGQFWFLHVLFICQMVGLAVGNRRVARMVVAVVALVLSYWPGVDGLPEKVVHNLFFFLIGAVLSDGAYAWNPARPVRWAIVFAPLLAASILGTGLLSHMNPDAFPSLPSTMLGVTAVALVACAVARVSKLVCDLGRASMTIYVLHVLFAAGTRIVLVRLHVPAGPWIMVLAGTVVGVSGPFAVHRLLARRGLLWPFGLAPLRAFTTRKVPLRTEPLQPNPELRR